MPPAPQNQEANPVPAWLGFGRLAQAAGTSNPGVFPMKKIVLSFAAVALLAGFAAGCAKTEEKPVAKIVRKG